jgi:hypothetical protein
MAAPGGNRQLVIKRSERAQDPFSLYADRDNMVGPNRRPRIEMRPSDRGRFDSQNKGCTRKFVGTNPS